MKKLIPILLLILTACGQDEPTPDTAFNLQGTRWSAYSFTSTVSGADVYKMMYFRSATEVEYYSARERTDIFSEVEVYTYQYTEPTLTITIDGQLHEGTVSPTFIRVFGKDFEKY